MVLVSLEWFYEVQLGRLFSMTKQRFYVADLGGKENAFTVGAKPIAMDGELGSGLLEKTRAIFMFKQAQWLLYPSKVAKGAYMEHCKHDGPCCRGVCRSV